MMWWAVWCAVVVSGAGTFAAPSELAALPPLDVSEIESPIADDDGMASYAVPAMSNGYPVDASSPWLYLLAEMPRNSQKFVELKERRARPKRKMPSLSISNPMEVLRQRLMQEVARKQMREANQRQAFANRVFLQNVGKRGYWQSKESRYDN